MNFDARGLNALQKQIEENAKAREQGSKPLKVLLEVEIQDPEWLGLDDYKEHPDINADLDVFNLFAKEEGSAFGALVNIIDDETPARFVAVGEDYMRLAEKAENQQQAMSVASEFLDNIYYHLSDDHAGQHIRHFLEMAKAHLNRE